MGFGAGDGPRRLARWMRAYSEVMSIAALLVGPPLAGLLLDTQLRVSPWGVCGGAILGVVLGIVKLMSWSESLSQRKSPTRFGPSRPPPSDFDGNRSA